MPWEREIVGAEAGEGAIGWLLVLVAVGVPWHIKYRTWHAAQPTHSAALRLLFALPCPAVVVVDFLTNPDARLPPSLAAHRHVASAAGGGKKGSGGGCGGGGSGSDGTQSHVWRPLRDSWDTLAAGADREWQPATPTCLRARSCLHA